MPSAAALIAVLAEHFPNCFSVYEARRRPLKLGVFEDLLTVGILPKDELKAALRAYCSNAVYRSRLIAGAARIDLEGKPAGEVTEVQAWPRKAKKTPAEQPEKQLAAVVEAPSPKSPSTTTSKRLSLADLRQAARARKGGAS
jgi:ProP effector